MFIQFRAPPDGRRHTIVLGGALEAMTSENWTGINRTAGDGVVITPAGAHP